VPVAETFEMLDDEQVGTGVRRATYFVSADGTCSMRRRAIFRSM
jgi:hypothetical protein